MNLPPRIGRYTIVERLGQGAMGVVYRGRDEGLDRDVAVKVIRGEALDEASRAQFLKEARAAARLQHANIVTIFELGEEGETPYLAMELLEGSDLQKAMRDGALSEPSHALVVIEQVLAGLGHAHSRGIVHRDMKPSNVFLHDGTRVKILDFGVARLGEGMTQTGRIVGTPHYMSPEQIRADRVDGRSDLFSTALMFYEMVTGVKAYRPGSAVTVMFQIVHEDPDLSRLPRTAVGAALGSVLRRALARDRDQRYPDAAALAAALSAAIDTPDDGTFVDPEDPEPVTAEAARPEIVLPPAGTTSLGNLDTVLTTGSVRPASNWALGTAPPRSELPAIDSVRAAPAPSRGPWLAIAVVAVLVVSGAAAWLWQGRAQPPTTPVSETPDSVASAPPPTVAPPSAPASAVAPSAAEPSTTPPVASPAPLPSASPAPSAAPLVPAASLAPTVPRPARGSVETQPSPSGPADPQSRLERANRLFEAGQLGAALSEARAVLRAQPDNTEAKYLADDIELDLSVEQHLKAARAALARGDRETARREAETGLKLKPNESRLGALLRQLDPP